MNRDEIDLPEFMNNESDDNKNIFKIMVRGRRLLQEFNPNIRDNDVADNLLRFNRIGVIWNNPADRVPIMRVEASNIRHLLRGIGRFRPNEEDEEEADSLIISLSNYMTNTEARGLRKRKRKRIKTKSRKSRKSRKTRKSRK